MCAAGREVVKPVGMQRTREVEAMCCRLVVMTWRANDEEEEDFLTL